MNQTIKERWISALLSGEYLQGHDKLHNVQTDEFCCLGVLCDLYIQDHPDVQWEHDYESDCYVIFGETGVLPSDVVTWAGLSDVDPNVKVPDDNDTGFYMSSLTEMNDNGRSFDQIAQLIGEHF